MLFSEAEKNILPKKRIGNAIFRLILITALAAACAVLLPAAVWAQTTAAPDLSFVSNSIPAFRFSCWISPADGNCYLYLPAGIAFEELAPSFTAEKAEVDGKAIVSGKKTELFSGEGPFNVTLDDVSFSLRVLPSSDLPALLIETESGSLDAVHADKAHKEGGTLTVLEHGRCTLSAEPLAYIRGRGNSTWEQEKKPYNLKLEKKKNLFGMGAAKKWCLLANAIDPTLLRNAAAYSLAQKTAIPYTVEYQMADLFVNGDYLGNYMLTEKVETGKERVDISNLDKANAAANPGIKADSLEKVITIPAEERNGKPGSYPGLKNYTRWPKEPSDISGGYLLEFDSSEAFDEADGGFVSGHGNCLILKSPEHVSEAEIYYIAEAYQAAEDAVLSANGKNTDGKHFSELLDLPSAADSYLLLEFTMDRDNGANSWFIYKEKNDPLFYAGPVWDFDISMEKDDGVLTAGEGYFSPDDNPGKKEEEYGSGAIFRDLMRHPEFRQLAYERWQPLSGYVKGALSDELRTLRDSMADSAAANAMRWHGAENANGTKIDGAEAETKRRNWIEATDGLLRFLSSRADTMSAALTEPDGAPENAGTQHGAEPMLWAGIAIFALAVIGGTSFYLYKNRKKTSRFGKTEE